MRVVGDVDIIVVIEEVVIVDRTVENARTHD